jgi:hypothetical protein
MTTQQTIEKHKKYLFQFPEGTETEKQVEYLKKINDSLESNDYVAVDPKIKIYEAAINKKGGDINENNVKDVEVFTEKKSEVTGEEQEQPVSDSQVNQTNQSEHKNTGEVTIEKVESTPVNQPEEEHPFMSE